MEILKIAEPALDNSVPAVCVSLLAFDFVEFIADDLSLLDGQWSCNIEYAVFNEFPVVHVPAGPWVGFLAGEV